MSAVDLLDSYLDELRRRLRRRAGAIAALGVALALLLATLAVALLLRYSSVLVDWLPGARVLLLALALATVVALAWRPLRRLRQRDGAEVLERLLPEQDGRIETWLELRRNGGHASPLFELLAQDAGAIAARADPIERVPPRAIWMPAAASAIGLLALIALLGAGGSFWGAGARALWLGTKAAGMLPAAQRRIDVAPGDRAVRRNQDVTITATMIGFTARDVALHVRFADAAEWETAPMLDQPDGARAFTLYALREPAAYYVTADGLRSREHQLRVADPPRIEQLRLTYHYPAWTGHKPHTQEDGGDIQAVAGTRVQLELRTDAPLDGPLLVIDEKGQALAQAGAIGRGQIPVNEPGQYRISARFAGELVDLTDNYRIAVTPDEKPTIEIRRPGRDYQASSIEEVPVSVRARDDFRLEGLELRYAVNGGQWRTEQLDAAASDINAAALLRLEELRQSATAPLEPGDIVSYYAVARDHRQSAQTDLFLIQVQPFDRRYTQSQAGGGGGGGGGGEDDGKISERQREILMATFNLVREASQDGRDAARVDDNAALLADLQKTLVEQVQTLVARAGARELTGSDANVSQFVKHLQDAAKAMQPAAERLARIDLQAAISDQQRALASLLRAEATFRDIQVAMQSASRGGGGGGQAGRDISEMTELELDLEKNQYETEARLPAAAANQAEDESLRRLRELARRQEQLARERAQRNATPEAQRWQQEQLRREAEELRQQLEQLAQQRNGSSSSSAGDSNSGGQSSSQQGAAAQALAQVQQAIEAMRQGRPGAEQNLRRAQQGLEQARQSALGERFDNLARDARRLTEQQQQSEQALRAAATGGRNLTFAQAEELAEAKRALQAELERLRTDMQAARQQDGGRAPQAAAQVGNAAQQLDEDGTAAGLARSALEIERGRGAPAVARDGLITESLRNLQRELDEAARVATTEAGSGGGDDAAAQPTDLLAELGQLRNALQRAQQQQQQGGTAGNGAIAGGSIAPGGADTGGGRGDVRGFGGGAERGRDRGALMGPQLQAGPALVAQARDSARQLQQLGERLGPGTLADADISALKELAGRLRRAGTDPMSGEYPRLQALLNQLEIAALRASAISDREIKALTELRGADPARYQDKVAEYYRRLAGP